MSRLDTEEVFAVRTEKAASFFPKDDPPVDTNDLTDYHRTGFPMVRADTIRELHSDHSPAQPLKGREDELLDAMTHPYVLDAARDAEEIREEMEATPPTDMKRLGKLKERLQEAERAVEERREQIESLLSVESGNLSAEQMNTLLDRGDIQDDASVLESLDGETYVSESGPRQAWTEWPAEIAQALYRDLPRRLLCNRARQLEEKPREMSIGQHVAEIGVERLMQADPHFRRDAS